MIYPEDKIAIYNNKIRRMTNFKELIASLKLSVIEDGSGLPTTVKDFIHCTKSIDQDVVSVGNTVSFDNVQLSRGLSYSTLNNAVSLNKDKIYRVTFKTSIEFSMSNGFIKFGIYALDNNLLSDDFFIITENYTESGNSSLDVIITALDNISFVVKVADLQAAPFYKLKGGNSSLIVQEI